MSFNRIQVYGFLGRDPELRYTPSGAAVCNFSIASTEKAGDREFTVWFKVQAWSKLAELCNEYLAKGKPVIVYGALRQEEYTDREGTQRTNLLINASEIHFVSGGSRSDSSDSQSEDNTASKAATAAQAPAGKKGSGKKVEEDDSEIPF
jgi:single-strand DNA-binding protein